jgi:4'-phosphopantetheinyl transferase
VPEGAVAWLMCSRGEVPAGDAWLSASERAEAASLRVGVRREAFRLRRWTARRALSSRLGLDEDERSLARLAFRRDALGAPQAWRDAAPLAVSVSLSDRDGRAVCVVGPPDLALGCDLERVEPRSAAFLGDFLTPRERLFVAAAASADDHDLRAALVWSGKESALKALGVGLRRDTRSLEVAVEEASAPGGWSPLHVTTTEGRRFAGWWRRAQDLVLTIAADPPPGVPAALDAAPADRPVGSLAAERDHRIDPRGPARG